MGRFWDTHQKSQYCWTELLKVFRNSPTLFGKALVKDLQRENGTILRYVEDILIAGSDKET